MGIYLFIFLKSTRQDFYTENTMMVLDLAQRCNIKGDDTAKYSQT